MTVRIFFGMAASEAPDALLAERAEGLISQEHAKWVTQQEQHKKGEGRK